MDKRVKRVARPVSLTRGGSAKAQGLVPWWRRHRLAGLALVAWGLGSGASLWAGADRGAEEFPLNREPAVLYREYLARMPAIRYVLYRRAHSRFEIGVGELPDGREKLVPRAPRMSELERFELGWQPEGWYWRELGTPKGRLVFKGDASIGYAKIPEGLERISGRNKFYLWHLDEGHMRLSVTFRTNTAGGQGQEHWGRELNHYANVKCDLMLGLDAMGPGQWRWLNDTEFEVEPFRAYFHHPGGRGRIVRFDAQGRPVEVTYEVLRQDGRRNSYRVIYGYLPERPFPPWLYVVEERDPREGLLRHTNYVDEIEFGLDPTAPEGYFPEMFRRRSEPLARFRITSNQVDYVVDLAGQTHVYQPPPGPETFSELVDQGRPKRLYGAVVVVTLVLGTIVAGWGWWWRRRRAGG